MRSDQIELVKQGTPILVRPTGTAVTKVYPLLFDCSTRDVRLNWEHTDAVWIAPADADAYDTVTKFKLLLKRLGLR